jgi:hypothetical protein
MSMIKATLAATAFALAASAPAFAGEGSIDADSAIVFNSSGFYMSGKVNSKGMTELMKNAKPLPGGVALVMSGGKFYVVDDPKGTLFQMARDKVMF